MTIPYPSPERPKNRQSISRVAALLVLLFHPLPLTAAPLDEFLTAMPGHEPMHGEVEAGYDVMNETVDLFGVRDEYLDPRGDSIGDYSGYHLRGGLALTRRLWVDGGLWRRSVKTPYDKGENYTWQVGAQYQATINSGWLPAVALRVSAWGDSADQVLKGSPTPFMGTGQRALNIRVEDPSDQQIQGDIIATWRLTPKTTLSTFLGLGHSEVEVDELFADLFTAGCEYKITPYSAAANGVPGIEATLVNSGSSNCNVQNFTYTNPARPIPEGLYVNYDADYYQLGAMLKWFNDDWRLKLGYRYQKWDRGELDEAVEKYQHADKTAYDSNHHITGEVGYKVTERVGIYFRPQYMTNQFVGEVPFSYNLYSSHKFKREYGFLTFGLTGGF